MSSKQFPISGDIVLPSLKAMVRSNPDLTLIENERVVYNKSAPKAHVAVLSGGGSGHEPTHAGFVGNGMLTAAVAGNIFASPSVKQIFSGLKAIETNSSGVLVIVKNYTGDVIHFGLAVEKFKQSNKNIEMVIVGDDVSVGKKKGGKVGRRGLAGTVMVHKIAGAAAQSGLELSQVAKVAQSVNDNLVTIATSLDHCNVPGRKFETNLEADEIEIGMGIHNEPGVKKVSPIPDIPSLVKELASYLLDSKDGDRSFVPFEKDDEVALLVNNLGGLSNLELLYISNVVIEQLSEEHGIKPVRIVSGTLTTALNGSGFSITLLNLSRASKQANHSIVDFLDAPTSASAWIGASLSDEGKKAASEFRFNAHNSEPLEKTASGSKLQVDKTTFQKLLFAGLETVKKNEPEITHFDTIAGDGDCGETLVAGATEIEKSFDSYRFENAVDLIADLSESVEDSMGGTSGGLYSIFLNALATHLQASKSTSLDVATFAETLPQALGSLYKYTNARPGDRTLIDTLTPFVEELEKSKDFGKAVEAAKKGCENTKQLEANFGRASYVNKDEYEKDGGIPDPGALGVLSLLQGIFGAYQ